MYFYLKSIASSWFIISSINTTINNTSFIPFIILNGGIIFAPGRLEYSGSNYGILYNIRPFRKLCGGIIFAPSQLEYSRSNDGRPFTIFFGGIIFAKSGSNDPLEKKRIFYGDV